MKSRPGRVCSGLLLTLVLAGTAMVFLGSGQAMAHGAMTFPTSRTHACYEDGKRGGNGGDLAPTNPACVEAVAIGGKQPLWDWFGNLLSDAGGRSREIIPDGHLCGPQAKYDAYNMPRADWPTTTMQAGAPVTFRYNAWAQHPGTWSQYVTKDGFDVTTPLKWSDLESAPFDSVTNPPVVDGEYSWPGQLPVGKSGRHIVYSIWQRSDSPEAFYSCSDVVFTGGDTAAPGVGDTPAPGGGDTAAPGAPGDPTATPDTGTSVVLSWPAATDDVGIGGYQVHREDGDVDAVVASSVEPSATVTGLALDTAYTFYVVATDLSGNASPASPSVQISTPAAAPPGACTVSYTRPEWWEGGYTTRMTVHNTGPVALSGWSLSWDYPVDHQHLREAWSSDIDVVGGTATARGADWNADLQPGASADFGYNSDTTGPIAVPTVFTLDGRACTGA